MTEQIIVTITPDGETKVEVKGAKGNSCLKLTESLEAALGGVRERRRTGDTCEVNQRAAEIVKQQG